MHFKIFFVFLLDDQKNQTIILLFKKLLCHHKTYLISNKILSEKMLFSNLC